MLSVHGQHSSLLMFTDWSWFSFMIVGFICHLVCVCVIWGRGVIFFLFLLEVRQRGVGDGGVNCYFSCNQPEFIEWDRAIFLCVTIFPPLSSTLYCTI